MEITGIKHNFEPDSAKFLAVEVELKDERSGAKRCVKAGIPGDSLRISPPSVSPVIVDDDVCCFFDNVVVVNG